MTGGEVNEVSKPLGKAAVWLRQWSLSSPMSGIIAPVFVTKQIAVPTGGTLPLCALVGDFY